MSSQLVSYHTSQSHFNNFAVPTTVHTVTIGGRTLRYGQRPRIGGWFIRDAQTGEYLPLPTYAAVRHYLSELRKKYEPTPPTTPSAPVALVFVRETVSIAAVSDNREEWNVLKMAHGEYYSSNELPLLTAIERFAAKYGIKPNLIQMNTAEELAFYGCIRGGLNNKYNGIPVRFVDAVPEDTYYLHYSPKAA